jgi:hypothetical protein
MTKKEKRRMQGMGKKLFGGFAAALIGYMWGWIWGWSLFDPNLDLWAVLAGVLALAGLALGLLGLFWRWSATALSAMLGLYLGWVLRTWLFGDKPGGWGILVMILVIGIAVWLALKYRLQERPTATITLLSVLFIGFFGGFLIYVLFGKLFPGYPGPNTILRQAPWVIGCGLLGWLVAAVRFRRMAQA